MANKNKSDHENQSLEERVDDMMDVKRPDPKPASQTAKSVQQAPNVQNEQTEPIDIFAAPQTAPEVSPELAEQMRYEPAATVSTPDKIDSEIGPEGVPDAPEVNEEPYADLQTDKAVDDIVKHESDIVLAARPTMAAAAHSEASHSARPKQWLAAAWQKRWVRYVLLGILIIALMVAVLAPSVRYAVLNTAHVRGSATLTVLDGTTQLPLKNVSVQLDNVSAMSNISGQVSLHGIPLGKQTLQIKRLAFATQYQTVTVGLGTTHLPSASLRAIGNQYKLTITDYLTAKPLTSAEASSGKANAVADKNGQVVVTVPPSNNPTVMLAVSAAGYRTQTVSISADTSQSTAVTLVPSQKDIFISNSSGKYDVMSVDLDGKNRRLLLAGSGHETAQNALLPQATQDQAALVSTRDNVRNNDGYLMQTLSLINTATGATQTLDHAEQVQLVDWIGTKLVYVRIKAGASAANPERYQMISYDTQSKVRLELAHANAFTGVVSAKGMIYYAAANNYAGDQSVVAKVAPDNTAKATLLSHDAWDIYRTDYTNFTIQDNQGWYSYKLGAAGVTRLTTAPANATNNRLYVDSPDGLRSLHIENRDGQPTLLNYTIGTQKETVVAQAKGMSYPARWLTDQLVLYRVAQPGETADYVVSTDGGAPKKVTDLSNASGASLWYY